MAHRGLAIIDVISPCVTFNDHEGSTKSYLFTRQHDVQMTVTDFVPPAEEISATIPTEGVVSIPMHDGATLRFRSVPEGYDPTDRIAVMEHLMSARGRGEIVTGLLYVDEQSSDLHELGNTTEKPLTQVPYEQLCPGSAALAGVGFR
jgi:2-oxoglutarate ferredoxin oxidoreductase subunit beta